MSDIVPHKLKVTELRDELKKRGLDTKGKKEQLVKRLLNALGMTDEAGADDSMATVDESDISHAFDTSTVSAAADEPPNCNDEPANGHLATEVAANEAATSIEDSAQPSVAERSPIDETCPLPVPPEVAVAGLASEAPSQAAESCIVNGDSSPTAHADSLSEQTAGCALYTLPGSESATSITSSQRSAADDSAHDAGSTAITSSQQPAVENSAPAADSTEAIAISQPPEAVDSTAAADSTAISVNQQLIGDDSHSATAAAGQSSAAVVSGKADAAPVEAAVQNDDSSMPVEELQGELPITASTGAEAVTADPAVLQADHETNVKMEQDVDAPPTTTSESLLENCVAVIGTAATDGSGDATTETKEPGDTELAISKVESRRSPSREQRSRSPRRRSRSPVEKSLGAAQPLPIGEDDSWLSSEDVQIDRYNSDLNLVMKDAYTTVPLCQAGFAYMWAGSKATHGVTSGKVAFEIKVIDEPRVDLPADDKFHNVARVGWSFDSGSTMLGEDKTSWGYGGTGKISHANSFKDYGKPFAKGDVITAYLDLQNASAVLAFSKNGQDLGTAYEISKSELKGAALFPTILIKNTEVAMNFGQKEAAYPLREGFVFIGHVPREQRVRAALPPPKKSDAEVLMMIGLPGAGKTYWAAKHCEAHPEKRFNVLGTNAIMDKMKVSGLYRKFNYAGRWDVLFDKSNKCLSKLIELACSKRRNYIIDQTNVYASAQKRKMKPFEGFRRKAVVVVPSEDEFRIRVAKRTRDEGKQVPEEAVAEMKANFSVPHVGEVFDEILYPELPEVEVRKLVAQYVKEGQTKIPPGSRRFNDRRSGSSQDSSSNRDAGRERGFAGPRDNYRNDRSGYGGNYRSGGGFNDGNAGFGNQRSERGYYPTPNPSFSAGDRGYGGVQNTNFGTGGSHVGQQQRPWDASPRAAGAAAAMAGPLVSGGGGAAAGGSGGWSASGGWAGNQAQHPYGSGGAAAGTYGPSGAGGYRGAQPPPAVGGPYGSRHDSYASRPGAGYSSQSVGHAPAAAASTAAGYGSTASAGYGSTASAGYGSTASAGYGGGSTSAGYGGAASSGSYGGAAAGGYGGATSGGYGGAAPGSYGGAASGSYGSAPSSGGYGSAATSGSYGGAPPSGGYGGVPSGSYGGSSASAAYGANPPSGYSRAQLSGSSSGGGGSSYYSSAQPGGAPAAAGYGGAQSAAGQVQSFGNHSAAGGYGSGQPAPHPDSYGSQASSAVNQSRAYGSGAYGSGQSGYGSWPAQQQQQPIPPPTRPSAATAPPVAPQQQWGQQHTSGSAWQQPSPSGYGSYGQRR